MIRCEATTKAGRRCRNNARSGSDFCAVHTNEVSDAGFGAALIGVAVGITAIPTLGGALIGGAVAVACQMI